MDVVEQVGFKVGINEGCLTNFHFEPLSSNNASFFFFFMYRRLTLYMREKLRHTHLIRYGNTGEQ